jgi:hypothetical protein
MPAPVTDWPRYERFHARGSATFQSENRINGGSKLIRAQRVALSRNSNWEHRTIGQGAHCTVGIFSFCSKGLNL